MSYLNFLVEQLESNEITFSDIPDKSKDDVEKILAELGKKNPISTN